MLKENHNLKVSRSDAKKPTTTKLFFITVLNQDRNTKLRMWVDTPTSLSLHEHRTLSIDTVEAKAHTSNKHF